MEENWTVVHKWWEYGYPYGIPEEYVLKNDKKVVDESRTRLKSFPHRKAQAEDSSQEFLVVRPEDIGVAARDKVVLEFTALQRGASVYSREVILLGIECEKLELKGDRLKVTLVDCKIGVLRALQAPNIEVLSGRVGMFITSGPVEYQVDCARVRMQPDTVGGVAAHHTVDLLLFGEWGRELTLWCEVGSRTQVLRGERAYVCYEGYEDNGGKEHTSPEIHARCRTGSTLTCTGWGIIRSGSDFHLHDAILYLGCISDGSPLLPPESVTIKGPSSKVVTFSKRFLQQGHPQAYNVGLHLSRDFSSTVHNSTGQNFNMTAVDVLRDGTPRRELWAASDSLGPMAPFHRWAKTFAKVCCLHGGGDQEIWERLLFNLSTIVPLITVTPPPLLSEHDLESYRKLVDILHACARVEESAGVLKETGPEADRFREIVREVIADEYF